MNNRTEEKLKSIDGMRKAMTEILDQAWERGRKFGRMEAQESSRGGIMDNKKASASELLKSMHRRDFICSECQKDDDECKSSCEYGKALDHAIKALENQPQWIPLSKYHPPKNAYYLTSTIYHEVYCDYWNGMNFNRTEAVLAWMPSPEPYTKEEQS